MEFGINYVSNRGQRSNAYQKVEIKYWAMDDPIDYLPLTTNIFVDPEEMESQRPYSPHGEGIKFGLRPY